jgi:asparagine synthase (glutamine-hydrolysing)
MSAIFGFYHLDGRPASREDLERMSLSLAHRGSDSAGLWNEGAVGLGNRLLWTTPESLHERLPLTSEDGDVILTADARIDNRDELLSALGLTDRPAQAISDSVLILAAYERWQEKCLGRFLGDFAFAIWDRRKRTLFCARDHFGLRPLYYYCRPGKLFAFASEIKTLLCLPEVPRRLNELRVADYLQGIFNDKTSTFYQDIVRLPPAHGFTIGAGSIDQRCYWSLTPSSEIRLGSNEDYAAAYREIFTKAVQCRLRSAFPLGSHLSGGLDSSSITCVARDLLAAEGDRRLNTYSLIFEEVPESDERPFINAVVDEGGVEPHYIHGDKATPFTDAERILWLQDEPFFAPNLFLNWQVWTAAREHGVRVLLDGIMGDNVVSHGFAYLNELARSWRWIKLTRKIKALARRRNVPYWKIVGRYVWNDGVVRTATGCGARETLNAVINSDFARRVSLPERIKLRAEIEQARLRSAKQDHYQELVSEIIPAALETGAKAAGAFNIELRIPFLDRRLVEFCLAIPAEQKIDQGWTRVIARRALVSHLPQKIRFRVDKGNLAPNFIRGLRSRQEELRELLFSCPELTAKIVNPEIVHKIYENFLKKQVSDDEMISLLSIAMLSLWFRHGNLDNAFGM